ncbi:MAG: hypothetical protein COA79_00420 [Planctomycetota bacterium]|nr:MAG: hypothetical protein COA79_00420 [Planctomycetota bacterium]
MPKFITYFTPGGYFLKIYKYSISDLLNVFCSLLIIFSGYSFYLQNNIEYTLSALAGITTIYLFNFIALFNLNKKQKDEQLYKSNCFQFNNILKDFMSNNNMNDLHIELNNLANNSIHLHELQLFKCHISNVLNKKEDSKILNRMDLTSSQKSLFKIIKSINAKNK